MANIPIKVYEEADRFTIYYCTEGERWLEWIDNNGINTPYIVTVVNNG